MQRKMGRGSQIPIWSSIVAYVLAQEGPELVFARRAGGDPGAYQGYGRQEHQTCRRSPGDVSLPDSPLSMQGLELMGIRPGQAPDPTRVLRLIAQRHLEGSL